MFLGGLVYILISDFWIDYQWLLLLVQLPLKIPLNVQRICLLATKGTNTIVCFLLYAVNFLTIKKLQP